MERGFFGSRVPWPEKATRGKREGSPVIPTAFSSGGYSQVRVELILL